MINLIHVLAITIYTYDRYLDLPIPNVKVKCNGYVQSTNLHGKVEVPMSNDPQTCTMTHPSYIIVNRALTGQNISVGIRRIQPTKICVYATDFNNKSFTQLLNTTKFGVYYMDVNSQQEYKMEASMPCLDLKSIGQYSLAVNGQLKVSYTFLDQLFNKSVTHSQWVTVTGPQTNIYHQFKNSMLIETDTYECPLLTAKINNKSSFKINNCVGYVQFNDTTEQKMEIEGDFHQKYTISNPYEQTAPNNRIFVASMVYNNPHTVTGFIMLGIGLFFALFGAVMTIIRKKCTKSA